MRVVVTRPQADSERSAAALRARGHSVLVAPLMRVEPVTADLSGSWGAVIITSANAPDAIAADRAYLALLKLPLFAIGDRSADAARQTGFSEVISASGDVRDLVRLIAERHADIKGPLLYLAGEDRAADPIGELATHGIAAEMRIVYRAVTVPYPPALSAALKAGEVDAVLHFSRRSAENYISGARQAGIIAQALAVWHFCLSRAIAEPLNGAGAGSIAVAKRPDEAALIELLERPQA
jgi:uroporphyrinogen-III synthase